MHLWIEVVVFWNELVDVKVCVPVMAPVASRVTFVLGRKFHG